MTEHTFERRICKTCHTATICYLHELNEWYCDNCFRWVVEHADKKDQIVEIFAGIEDIESYGMAVE